MASAGQSDVFLIYVEGEHGLIPVAVAKRDPEEVCEIFSEEEQIEHDFVEIPQVEVSKGKLRWMKN